MKKYIIFIITVAILLLSGCGFSVVNDIQSYELENNNNFTFINLKQLKINDFDIPIFTTEEDFFHLVSYIDRGKEILHKENVQSNNLLNDSNDIKSIFSKDYYTTDSTQYSMLNDKDIILKGNGGWEYITSKVKYTNYVVDKNASPKQKWVDYFSERLTNMVGKTSTPVIITDSWEFIWDGNITEIIIASNIMVTEDINNPLPDEKTVKPVIPSGENHVMYEMSVMFINDTPVMMGINDICDDYSKISLKSIQTNISADDPLYSNCSFVPPSNGQVFEYAYNCAQIDENNNIIYCPVFIESNCYYGTYREFDYKLKFLVADINGDAKTEVLAYNKGHSSNSFMIIAYNLDNNSLNPYIIE